MNDAGAVGCFEGAPELLEGLAAFALSPVQGRRRTAKQGTGDEAVEITLEPNESAEFVGQVFKTLNDKFVGNLSFFRVFSGKMSSEQPLVNLRTGKSARTGGLLEVQGKAQKPVGGAIAGDIVAVAKVEDLHIGDTVANNPNAPKLPPGAARAPGHGS